MGNIEFDLVWQIIGFVALLLASAFFSGSETALFNLKRSELEHLKHDLAPSSRAIVRMMNTPRRLLITILTGNTLVNVALAAMAALITAQLAESAGFNHILALVLETLVLTVVLVIMGEITPKVVAIRHSLGFASRIAGLMNVFYRLVSPVANILYRFVERLVSFLGVKPEETFTSDDEIKELVELGQDRGVIGEEEREMIHSVIDFSDTEAKEVMIPRPDVAMLHTEMSRKEVLDLVKETGFSKYPLYRDQIDNIRGIVFIKDILPYLRSPSQRINLERISRTAMFVPEHQPIDALLRGMQLEKQKLAMVVDEYGGMSGMVAVEDIVEEVLGDLRDELDTPEELEIRKIEEHAFLVDGATHLDDVSEALHVAFPEDRDYDSIGGYIYDACGRIPDVGEKIKLADYTFTVEEVDKNRIERIRAERDRKAANG